MALERYHIYQADVSAVQREVLDFVRDYTLLPDSRDTRLYLSPRNLYVRRATYNNESQHWSDPNLHYPTRISMPGLMVALGISSTQSSRVDLSIERDYPGRAARKSLIVSGGTLALSGSVERQDLPEGSRNHFSTRLDSGKAFDMASVFRLIRDGGNPSEGSSYTGLVELTRIKVAANDVL